MQLRHTFDLPRQIRRCVDQKKTSIGFGVGADGDAGLRPRRNLSCARGDAVGTGTVPLRQATTGCAAENMDADQPEFRST